MPNPEDERNERNAIKDWFQEEFNKDVFSIFSRVERPAFFPTTSKHSSNCECYDCTFVEGAYEDVPKQKIVAVDPEVLEAAIAVKEGRITFQQAFFRLMNRLFTKLG